MTLRSAMDAELDALIITGAQPRAARLSDEPSWEELIELIDWAKEHTSSTILSCLAARAEVLHLDGVEHHRLSEKCAGVFAFEVQRNHPFAGEQGRCASLRTLAITAFCRETLSVPVTKS